MDQILMTEATIRARRAAPQRGTTLGSMAAPWRVGLMLGAGDTVNAAATIFSFGVETRGRVLEDISPDLVMPALVTVAVQS